MKIALGTITALVLGLACGQTHAGTYVVNNGSVSIDVANRQMSRITIRGDKIASVHEMDDPQGPTLLVQKDDQTGDMYVGFDKDAAGRTYSAFLTLQSGDTFQMLLHPSEILAANVEIVPENKKSEANTGPSNLKSPGYSEALVAFEKVMFLHQPTDGVLFTASDSKPEDTPNLTIRTIGFYKAEGIEGIELDITNHSTAPQELKCESFLVKHVLACGISNEMLEAGQNARVYIVQEIAR